MKKVCALVPVYNECLLAGTTINSLKKIEIIDKIVVIDDGSDDDTWTIINNISGIERIKHKKNMGKAESIRDGIKKYDSDIYVFVDGDLGQSVENLQPLIEEVIKDRCDLCIARFPESKNTGGVGFLRFFCRFMVKLMAKMDFPCPLSGQRAVTKQVLTDKRVKLYKGYGIEIGMLMDAINSGYRVGFVDIDLTHRTTGKDLKGYFHRIKQFNDIFYVLLRQLLRC